MLFGIIFPIALIVLVYAFFKLRNITPNSPVKLDVLSLIISSIGFGGLLFGFSTAGDNGWTDPTVYGTIIIGFIALTTFIVRQLRMDDPILDFKIYKYPMFALSSAISIVISVAMFSGMILTPLYVQEIRGISPFESGLLMLPGAVVMGLMSPISGRLFDKYGARAMAVIGLAITVYTTYTMSTFTIDSSYFYIMSVYTVRMIGMSLVMMPVMTNGLNQIPMVSNPHGTAINNTLQQVSGAIGSALLLTIMTKKMESSGEALFAEAIASGDAPASSEGLEALKIELTNMAMLDGINFSFFIATLVATVALILALFIQRVTPPKYGDNLDEDTASHPQNQLLKVRNPSTDIAFG